MLQQFGPWAAGPSQVPHPADSIFPVQVQGTEMFNWKPPPELEKHFLRQVGSMGSLTQEALLIADSTKSELKAVEQTIKDAMQRLGTLWPEVAPYTGDPKLQAVVHVDNFDEPPRAPWEHDSVSPYEHALQMGKRALNDQFLASRQVDSAIPSFTDASQKVQDQELKSAYDNGKIFFSAKTEGEFDVAQKPPSLVTPFARADGDDEEALHCEQRCRPRTAQEKMNRALARIEGHDPIPM